MSAKPRVIRGRMIKQGDILVDTREDGGLHISAGSADALPGKQVIDLREDQALLLYELLPAVFDWGGGPEPEEPR